MVNTILHVPTLTFLLLSAISIGVLLASIYLLLHIKKKLIIKENVKKQESLECNANRKKFYQQLEKHALTVKKNKSRLALFFLDLDNFKAVNESFGPKVGDELLTNVADRLKELMVNQSLLVSHLDGDEFGLLIETKKELSKDLEKMAVKIEQEISKPFYIKGHEIRISISIGICTYPDCAHDTESLFKLAEISRDEAKKQGRNIHSFYTIDKTRQVLEQSILGEDLHKAIEKDELFIMYQPKISLETGLVASAESLIRWAHPKQGNVSPEIFIKLAEKNGMISEIGDWIIHTVCHDLRRLHVAGDPQLSIAINLSSSQFNQGDVAGMIATKINEANIPPSAIEIELTESLIMQEPEKSLLMLRVLKSMGIKVAIDDFGTGYSSLSYLKNFPVDILKIDQAFVRNLASDKENRVIVSTIISMAKKLGLKVVAEGVENKEEVEILKEEGCNYIQGYYYSKPLRYEGFKNFCDQRKQQEN